MLLTPPRGIARIPIRTIELTPSKLLRVSTYLSGEPYFGRSAANRFDDPTRTKKSRFGTCYLGESLEVAIAETILHDEMPVKGHIDVAANELERRFCVRFAGGSPLSQPNSIAVHERPVVVLVIQVEVVADLHARNIPNVPMRQIPHAAAPCRRPRA